MVEYERKSPRFPHVAESSAPETEAGVASNNDARRESREDDIRLVAAAQRGDRHAMDTLLRKHYGYISAVTRRLTNNEADAADSTQNALIAVAKGIHKFDGTSAFTTWLHRVATNAALDELRRRKRRPEPVSIGAEPQDDEGAQERAVRNRLAALDINLDRIDDRTGIDGALAQIPFDFRAPVMLRDLCGLDYAEIAEVLGIPAGTVRSRIARGRAALAPLLRPMLDGSQPLPSQPLPSRPLPTPPESSAKPHANATNSPPGTPNRDERHQPATDLREPSTTLPTSKAPS
jgi:RNA polymerase sigma-70 factor, ECF subfamily